MACRRDLSRSIHGSTAADRVVYKRHPLRKVIAGLLLGVGASAVALLLGATGLLDTAELKAYDWRVRQTADPASVRQDIVLVEINDTSIRDLAPFFGRWPWPRVVLGVLIDFLARGGAKVVAVDLTVLEEDRVEGHQVGSVRMSGAESDAALVESIRSAGNVVMLAEANYEGAIGAEQMNTPPAWRGAPYHLGPAIEERRLIVAPLKPITDAVAGLGHNFFAADHDGPARRMLPFVRKGDQYMPSLGVAAALVAGGFKPEEIVLEGQILRIRDRRIQLIPTTVRNIDDPAAGGNGGKTREQLAMLINYRAPTIVDNRRPYRSYEARHVIASEMAILEGLKPELDPAVFKDKIVFVGLTTFGLVDVFTTPFESTGVMPGIQLHAYIADSVLSNRFVRPAPDALRIAGTLGGALAVGLLAALLPYMAASAGALGAVAIWTWYAVSVFRSGLWVNMTHPLVAVAIALFAGTAYRYFVEERQKRVVKKLFGRYVSKDVYHQLIANPDLAQLGGGRREMTVLFSDIRGFTSITEKGEPEALVAQLNEYFSRMVELVFQHKGTVDKFVGDMVMALYGAPLDDPEHADHAVQTAVHMVAELGVLNRKWQSEGKAQLDIGVGVNSGDMIAGNIGSSSIMSYTVIGDNVNLGSRLESLNKEYKTRIIISDATRARLKTQYELRPLGDVVVKGKSRPVAIFEVQVPAPLAATPEEVKI
jgi:adenylate cyclase